MNIIYKSQYNYLDNKSNYPINYSILNSHSNYIYKFNIPFDIKNKKDYLNYYNSNNWYCYPYYLSGIFVSKKQIEFIPYIKWKLQNVKQRL